MSMRRVLRRSVLLAAIVALMLSLVPVFIAPVSANGCYGDYYYITKWTTSLTPVGGGSLITRSGSGDYAEVCYSSGKVDEVYVEAGYSYELGALDAYIVAPEWKYSNAATAKPSATLKYNTLGPAEIYGGGIVVLPGGDYGYMQAGTTVDITINYNNGNLTMLFQGKVCNDGTCFKFKTEIKGKYATP